MWMFKLCNDFIMMCSYWALWSTFPFESTLDLITLRFQFLFRTRFDKEINLSPMSPSFKIDLFQKTFYVKNGSDNLTLKQLYQPIFSCTWILSLKNKTLSFSCLKCNLLVSVSPTQNKRIVCGCHYNTFFDRNLFVKSPNPAFSYSKERMDFFFQSGFAVGNFSFSKVQRNIAMKDSSPVGSIDFSGTSHRWPHDPLQSPVEVNWAFCRCWGLPTAGSEPLSLG